MEESKDEETQGENEAVSCDLPTLLQFPLKEDMKPSDFYPHFRKIAHKILNGCALVAKTDGKVKLFRIIEIEFYCKHEKLHNDNFAHQDVDQLEFLKWYFHKAGKSYKGGTYKGIDIAFGRKDDKLYGGILMRTLQDSSTMEVHEGSCNLVNKMFKFFDSNEVKDFIEDNPHFSKSDIHKKMSVEDVIKLKNDDKANALTLVEFTGGRSGFWKSRPVYRYIRFFNLT